MWGENIIKEVGGMLLGEFIQRFHWQFTWNNQFYIHLEGRLPYCASPATSRPRGRKRLTKVVAGQVKLKIMCEVIS